MHLSLYREEGLCYLCPLSDVYDILSTVPDWKESKYSEQYSNAKLRKMADDIRAKYGIRRKTARSSINGVARW